MVTAHCVGFISKVLSLPPLQNTSPTWTKHRALTAPPYNNELGHCLLTGVTSHVCMMVACGCAPKYEAKGSLIFGLRDSNLLKGRAYSGSQNLKVARLDYNVNWNIITSPAQCLCAWHNSTGGFRRGETFLVLTSGTSQEKTLEYITLKPNANHDRGKLFVLCNKAAMTEWQCFKAWSITQGRYWEYLSVSQFRFWVSSKWRKLCYENLVAWICYCKKRDWVFVDPWVT